ncbi:10696_t:CDS:1, partial [Paraglomus brasilianum]
NGAFYMYNFYSRTGLPELLSKVSELEEVSMEYLTLFFLLLFLETSLFNLLDGGCAG